MSEVIALLPERAKARDERGAKARILPERAKALVTQAILIIASPNRKSLLLSIMSVNWVPNPKTSKNIKKQLVLYKIPF